MADVASSVVLTIVFLAVTVAAVTLNLLLIAVFALTPRLRTAPHYFVVSLAAADVCAAVLWSLPSAVCAAAARWPLGAGLCAAQDLFSTLFHAHAMHVLSVLAFERCLRLVCPSKHVQVFGSTVTLLLLAGLWVFDFVIALLPSLGWGPARYFPAQYQCVSDPSTSVSHHNFRFVLTTALPVLAVVVCYVLVFRKVRAVRRQVAPPGGRPVLEEDLAAPKVTYSALLLRQQRRLQQQNNNRKKRKPKIEPEKPDTAKVADDGYGSEDSGFSLDEEGAHAQQQQAPRTRIHTFREYEYRKAVTVLLVFAVYLCCHLPLTVVTYVWTYALPSAAPSAVTAVAVIVAHLGLVLKCVVYVAHNRHFRACALRALGRRGKAPDNPRGEHHLAAETKTRREEEVVTAQTGSTVTSETKTDSV